MKQKSINFKKIFAGSLVLFFIIIASFFIFEKAFAGLCSFDTQAMGGGGYVGGEDEMADKNCNQATSSSECSGKSADGCVWDGGGGSVPTCATGWSDEVLVYDGWVGSGPTWCNNTPYGRCNPLPNGQTGGHDPSAKGSTTLCCRGSDNLGWARTCNGTPLPPPEKPAPEVCDINSFTADSGNTSITNNTGTTLHYSLTMTGPNPFTWNITLQGGGTVLPNPYSGTNISGTSSTGNLTQSQTYRLSCGGAIPLDVTVLVTSLVTSPPEVCQDSGANNYGRTGACTYTTTCQERSANNFGGALPCTYPPVPPASTCDENASVSVTQPLPPTMNPGQTYSFTMRAKNTGSSWWYHGNVYQFIKTSGNMSITPSMGWLPTRIIGGDYTDWTFNVTAPSTPGNYFVKMQMLHTTYAGGNYLNPDGSDCAPVPTSDVYFGNVGTVSSVVSAPNYTLTLNKAGNGSGVVMGGGPYPDGSTADATAKADVGSAFDGWSGACSGQGVDSDHRVSVLMDANKTCTATFVSTQQQADGFLDSADCNTLRGWAWDPDFPDNKTSVNMYDNGVFFSTIPAGDNRADLPGDHKHAFTISTPDAFKTGTDHTINFYAMDLNGDGNPNLSGSPVTLNCPAPTVPSGTISATSCSIPEDQSTCDSLVTWTTKDLTSGKTEVKRNNPDVRISLDTSDINKRASVNHGQSTFFLYHNITGTPTPLANARVTAECASGTMWDVTNICKKIPGGLSGTLTPEKPSCDIPEGRSNCPINFSWNTEGTVPGGTISAVTTDYPAPNTHVSVPDANSGNGVPFTIKYDIQTFYLINTRTLAESTVTANCKAGVDEWKGGKCTKIPVGGCLHGVLPFCCANGANNLTCDDGSGNCSDGIKNGNETDTDFGGRCGNGSNGNCSDGFKNGNETGIDFGGRCGDGTNGNCFDDIQNGDETGINTGGRCDINRIPTFKEN